MLSTYRRWPRLLPLVIDLPGHQEVFVENDVHTCVHLRRRPKSLPNSIQNDETPDEHAILLLKGLPLWLRGDEEIVHAVLIVPDLVGVESVEERVVVGLVFQAYKSIRGISLVRDLPEVGPEDGGMPRETAAMLVECRVVARSSFGKENAESKSVNRHFGDNGGTRKSCFWGRLEAQAYISPEDAVCKCLCPCEKTP